MTYCKSYPRAWYPSLPFRLDWDTSLIQLHWKTTKPWRHCFKQL